jgi:Fe-S-cluster containining protein
MTEEIHRPVLALYAEVDAAVAAAGPKCDASGRCCRFKEWGHVLYLSALEAEVLLAGAPTYAKPVSPDFCPFQKENLCTAREPRPLGCRIYFCDPTYQETGNAIMEDALRRLKQLTAELGRDWRYAPLHVFLNEAAHPARLQQGGADEGAAEQNNRTEYSVLSTQYPLEERMDGAGHSRGETLASDRIPLPVKSI